MPPNMNLMTTKILHIIFNFLIISSSFTFRDKNLMYDVNAAPASSSSSSSSSSSGIQMKRTPESTVAPLGDEVLFECELDVAPDQLKWRYHALNSDDNNKHDYIFITNEMAGYNITTKNKLSKLRVYVSQNTVGDYQCVVWFGASGVASVPAKLSLADIVLEANPTYDGNGVGRPSTNPIRYDVTPGNTVLIKCGNVISNPEPIWTFYKDDRPMSSSAQQLPTGALILSSVKYEDSGSYRCSAINSITTVELKLPQIIQINVRDSPQFAPKFIRPPPSLVSVKPGNTAILECPGIGNPVPKATWSCPDNDNRGRVFKSDNRTKTHGYGVEILSVLKEDAGTYFCELDNGRAPTLVHKIRLEVIEQPYIEEGPKPTLTNESDSLILNCRAKGSPKPDIYWMINGQNCKWDSQIVVNGSRLFIKAVEKRHAGVVQCFARNVVGEVTAWDLLQVNPKRIPGEYNNIPLGSMPHSTKEQTRKPQKRKRKRLVPPSAPSVTRLSDESVMVRWSVPSNDGLPIQFFKVQYRMLGDVEKKVSRSQWMTANDDIPPHVRSYEVDSLKPDHYYRFRIAAVYSDNDNKLGNTTGKFLLQRGSQLGPSKSRVPAPTLDRIEPISEISIVIHWSFPFDSPNPIDGFYVYYRPASTAGEYSKATADGMVTRNFRIDHLEPDTAYEFKLQSFTSSAASDFSAILTGKTLKPPTPPPVITPSVIPSPESSEKHGGFILYVAGAGGCLLLFLCCSFICFCRRKKKNATRDETDITENKPHHPDHIQADGNGFSSVGGGRGVIGSPMHKRNGISPRMNITPNPMAQESSDRNRNVMELRFLPTTGSSVNGGGGGGGGGGDHQTNPGGMLHTTSGIGGGIHSINNSSSTPDPHRRTLERSQRNIVDGSGTGAGSRRTRRSSGSGTGGGGGGGMIVPGSPRIMRGASSEYIQHNRSPMPVRTSKRGTRLGTRTENMSSGSLNSIEV